MLVAFFLLVVILIGAALLKLSELLAQIPIIGKLLSFAVFEVPLILLCLPLFFVGTLVVFAILGLLPVASIGAVALTALIADTAVFVFKP